MGKPLNNISACVIGSGNWGTAFSKVLIDSGTDTTLYGRNQELLDSISKSNVHPKFKNVHISSRLKLVSDLKNAVKNKDIIFLAVPAQSLRDICLDLKSLVTKNQKIVSLIKGIDLNTKQMMSEIILSTLDIDKNNIAVLSGPNLSIEVINRHPCAAVVASYNLSTAKYIAKSCSASYFFPFTSKDVTGVEICGDLKNVIAVMGGIIRGFDFGINSLSSVITRGLAEITDIGGKLGASKDTFLGLSGVGDLVATCSSPSSRNNTLGYNLAKGTLLKDALESSNGVAEGYWTAKSAYELSQKFSLNTPIIDAVYKILYDNEDVYETCINMLQSFRIVHE